MLARLIACAAAVAASGCSFLFEPSAASESDASTAPDSAPADAPGPDAAPNTNFTDYRMPYGCDPGTIAVYHFDDQLLEDGCGSAFDRLRTYTPDPGGMSAPGQLDRGVAFDGSGVIVSERPGTTAWVDGFALDMWFIATEAVSAERQLVSARGSGGVEQFALVAAPTGQSDAFFIQYRHFAGSCRGTEVISLESGFSEPIKLDTWTHVRVSVNPTAQVAEILIDGMSRDQDTMVDDDLCRGAGTLLTIGGRLELGPMQGQQEWVGAIDELRLSSVPR